MSRVGLTYPTEKYFKNFFKNPLTFQNLPAIMITVLVHITQFTQKGACAMAMLMILPAAGIVLIAAVIAVAAILTKSRK
jgi:hypothetical protein